MLQHERVASIPYLDRILLVLVAVAFSSCASVESRRALPPPLVQACQWNRQAQQTRDADKATGLYLAAIAKTQANGSAAAQPIYNRAVEGLVALIDDRKITLDGKTTYAGPDGQSYTLTAPKKLARAEWPNDFKTLEPAPWSKKPIAQPLQWTGWGVALNGQLDVDEQDRKKSQPFAPWGGYHLPVTAFVEMQKDGKAVMRWVDPGRKPVVRAVGQEWKLAANLYAPTARTFRVRNPLLVSIRWLLQTDHFEYPTQLIFTEPYDPTREPVLLVHGLLSTPHMWGEVIEQLEADPFIRQHFQFWCYLYPNGQPIPLSASQLRDDLAAAEKRYQLDNGLILVGHSMGGLLSRLQVTDSRGQGFFNDVFGARAPEAAKKLTDTSIVKKVLFFEPNPKVRKVVFICTPHRGSTLALSGPAGWAAALIRLPSKIVSNISDFSEFFTEGGRKYVPNSIRGLSPKSPFLTALSKQPILAPHYTILGDRGRGGNLQDSSDGVVPYWSAHLDTAQREVVVPSDHGSFRHPIAIEEMKRILHESAGKN